jgi:uncharacterized membrane protein YcaP (DUF421 family)
MEVVYRAAFVFGFLWFITRVTGRATLGELSTFQLLVYVTMGDLIQQSVTQQDQSVTAAVLAVGVFTLLTIGLSWINSRSKRLRPLTHGTPVVVVHGGEPILSTLRRERVSLDDLMAAARNEGIDRFSDIRVAVLETNGKLSFFTSSSDTSGAPEQPSVG